MSFHFRSPAPPRLRRRLLLFVILLFLTLAAGRYQSSFATLTSVPNRVNHWIRAALQPSSTVTPVVFASRASGPASAPASVNDRKTLHPEPIMSPPIEQKPITMAELQTEPPPAEVQIPPHWQLDEPIPRGDFRQWRKRTFAKWADWGLLSPESKKAIEEDNASADDSEESADEDEAKKDKKEPKCDDSHPFRYSVVFFQPGFNIQGLEDGKSRVYSDGGALTIGFDKMNALVRGYANYFGDGSIGWTPPVVGSAEDTDNSNDTILSLGHFGVVVVKILNGYLVDSPGPDFTVTENPFYDKRRPGTYYIERGVAGVAEEWGSFREFECSLEPVTEVDQEGNVRRTYPGCAGNYPMIIGGDQFDLVNLGDKMPKKIRYIMVRDMGLSDRSAYDNKEGFDLDSLLILGKICDDSAAATEGGLL